uniref:Disease resistance N-terminal domain-containing protein n=1 Tax=Saccharum hybrid cultivar R570 TaxID=131158 RepID=A0A059Q1P7_9POAL|nr:hypothetical protein SHCRBa_089_D15_F_10 [Saccharum hybrid cultivar R570]
MAGGLLSPLLSSASKLLDLLRRRPSGSCPPPSGRSTVSGDVERLERLLRRIQATLDDAGEREVRDSSVKLWMEELMDLAHDAEDVLDDHRYELLRRQVQERQEAAAAASSATVKRKHDGEDGTISEMLRKITRRFEISADRAAVQLRPEEDCGTSEQIGEDAQRFQEISIDRAAPQLRPEDEHGGISEVTHIPAAVPPNYTTSVANNYQLIRSESRSSHADLKCSSRKVQQNCAISF